MFAKDPTTVMVAAPASTEITTPLRVGVGGGTHGEVLGDRHTGGVTVDGGGGAEHKVVTVVLAHHIQDDQRASSASCS